ncbi:MAG: MAPEG family protein [Parvularculaceae bacterium]
MTLPQLVLFGAILAQALLTIALYAMLIRARFGVPRAELRKEMAYDQSAWPVKARLVSNSVTSQFELPILFYVGALLALQVGTVDIALAALAWLFVVLRVAHAVIHTGKNIVMRRFGVFFAGFVTLIAFWIWLSVRAFAG